MNSYAASPILASIILSTCTFLSSCIHPLAIQGNGDIVELLHGERGCTLEEHQAGATRCRHNVVYDEYHVSYEGRPRPGWKFVRWDGTGCSPQSVPPLCDYHVSADDIAGLPRVIRVPPTIAVFEPLPTTGLIHSSDGVAEGYVLFSPNISMDTYLVDHTGELINRWDIPYNPGLIGYLLPDGSLVRTSAEGESNASTIGAAGLVERYDWDGNLIWSFSYATPNAISHHDIEVMPNGNILLLAWELKSEAEATQAGRDPDLPGPGFLLPDHIVEIEPDLSDGEGGTIVWEWHVWDHLVQVFDATKDNWYGPTGVQDHPELVDINFVSTFDEAAGPAEDWTHANAITYHPEFDQIMISVREFSEIWIIDHSTTTAEAAGHSGGRYGKGGDLLYRWGNPQTYDRGDATDRQLYYQHDSKWIAPGFANAGNVTLFDNGFGQPGEDRSRSIELELPVDNDGNYPTLAAGEVYAPSIPVWTYTAEAEDFSAIISGSQRLAGGTTFLTYGPKGAFTQVTAQGEEVWRYVNPWVADNKLGPYDPVVLLGFPPVFPGFETLHTNYVFRAVFYPPGYAPQL